MNSLMPFRLETVCLFQRLVIGQFIRKSFPLDRLFACWLLRKLGISSFARSVKFLSLQFWSELATDEVVLHGTISLDSKIRSQNVHFHDSFWREHTLAATKSVLSLTRIDFAWPFLVGSYAFLVGPYAFFRPYHFDAYGPHTGPFLLRLSKEIARGSVRVI